MNDLKNQYSALVDEVSEFKFKLENSQYFNKLKDAYKGFQILYSPLQYKPDFMFIGINPAAGYFKSTGQYANRLSPEKTMEYEYENYALGRETKTLFKMMELSSTDLIKTVKTNFYFVATENERDLNVLIETLDAMNFEAKSKEWNRRLIEIIKPKRIICEGKSAFTKVLQNNNLNATWKTDVAFTKWKDISVFGYKRLYSNIKNKEQLSRMILGDLGIYF